MLANSNPATIQTDSDIADRIYIEPLTVDILEKIIEKERPEGLLATVGGQTALNLSMKLHERGILERYGVKFLGTSAQAIQKAESRDLFNATMRQVNVPILPGAIITDIEEGLRLAQGIGYPIVVRPSFTLGGTGGGIASTPDELAQILAMALRLSATHEALIEKSVAGWGEFEYEVVRDAAGSAIVICNMENFDPMGVHTGESIVVAPSQTLSDTDHQTLRNAALRIVHAIGIEGGCNVQFSFNQISGQYAVIEVNPRLSRSSALASKATGYPIARVAAKIAIGKRLHEIRNAISGTSAAFEPALDYVVTKIPRWPFDKFRFVDRCIGTQMKSTGETMGIGRTFEESLLKAVRSLEVKPPSFASAPSSAPSSGSVPPFDPEDHLNPPTDLRLFALLEALRRGHGVEALYERTRINRWFLERLQRIVGMEQRLAAHPLHAPLLREAKRMGFSDARIASIKSIPEEEVRKLRWSNGIRPVYKMVDSCAGEFEALTPYYYSTYEQENEAQPPPKAGRKVMVIGGGPIRIGQGIEFDYCCTHASIQLRELGIRSIVVNNNPETVSTDFDFSDRLYFEPLTAEDVLHIIDNEKPDGVIIQLGGQTSLNLAEALTRHGVPILGTSYDSIDIAEDRDRFRLLLHTLKIPQPQNGTATTEAQAVEAATRIGYPIVVRPSYVIAGRAMAIVYDEPQLRSYIREAVEVSERRPVLIDKYLEQAIECEVDALCDGTDVFIGAVMEHVEFAGVHSGDANIVIPSIHLKPAEIRTILDSTATIARALKVVGLLNMQYAVKDGIVYVLEANPRASRTIPFVSKTIGLPLAKLATRLMLGEKLKDLKLKVPVLSNYAVKSVVFPFLKLKGSDIALGPEMKSTGETMGLGPSFEIAYYKALLAAGMEIKSEGYALLSLNDETKPNAPRLVRMLKSLGLSIAATPGTARVLPEAAETAEAEVEVVHKIGRGSPDVLQFIEKNPIAIVINTPRRGGASHTDGFKIRRLCIEKGIPCLTNMQTALALIQAETNLRRKPLSVKELKEYWPKK